MLDLFALHKLWCEVHFAERQAHESVARASVRAAAWSRRVRTGGIRRPTRGTMPVQTFAEINGFQGASTVPPAGHRRAEQAVADVIGAHGPSRCTIQFQA